MCVHMNVHTYIHWRQLKLIFFVYKTVFEYKYHVFLTHGARIVKESEIVLDEKPAYVFRLEQH